MDGAGHVNATVMLAAVHTAISGWDVLAALAVVFVAVLLDGWKRPASWLPLLALFGVALLVFALLVVW